MANTFITPDIVSRLAYANLYEKIIMTGLVYRDYEADYTGDVGDTITVRKPATFTAQEWNAVDGLTIQDATEGSFTVTLDKILDVSFKVPSKEKTLSIKDVNEQLVKPAVEALVQKVEETILTLRDDITQEVGHAGATVVRNDYDDPRVLIDAGQVLNLKKVPRESRRVVVGPTIEAAWTSDPLFHEADKRGDTVGLQEAALGRKFGFDTYSTTHIEEPASVPASGAPTSEVGIAFHSSALALVCRTLALPEGAASSAAFGDRGVGIRVVRDYDMDTKAEIVSLDVLCGVKTLDANRAVLIKAADAV